MTLFVLTQGPLILFSVIPLEMGLDPVAAVGLESMVTWAGGLAWEQRTSDDPRMKAGSSLIAPLGHPVTLCPPLPGGRKTSPSEAMRGHQAYLTP